MRHVLKLKYSGAKDTIIVLGNIQIHGVDYGEKYDPFVKFTYVRVMLASVSILCLELQQMDFVTDFLRGYLDTDIYMNFEGGLKDGYRPNLV